MTSPILRRLRHSARPRRLASLAAITCVALASAAPAGALAATSRPQGSPSSPGQNSQNSKVVPHDQRSAGLGTIKPSFKCKKPGHSHSVTVTVDLSSVHVTHKYDRHHPTNLKLDISGSPKFTLSFDFKGNVECTAKALVTVPLGDTGLELKIGPKLKFDADGEVGADFTWQPSIEFGFTLNRHGFTHVVRSLKNGTGIDFTGNGSASLSLGVDTVVETDGGVAGLEGVVGPVLTANVTADSATGTTCWSGALSGEADFTAFVRVFHFLQAKAEYDKKFGHRKLAGNCTSAIVFDGSPGTGAPPPTLGPYTMQTFQPDPTPEGTAESQLSGPTGTLTFDSALTHDLVGSNWQTWSNGYTRDVYEDDTELPDGSFETTVTLPPGTGAFYAYAEPNLFEDFDMSASAQDGPSSGDVTVFGDAGAQYFGFYATCGHTINSITFTDGGGDTAMAIGEFGIAPASACQAAPARTS